MPYYQLSPYERWKQNVGSEDIPEISTEQVIYALRTLKSNKAPGEDKITTGRMNVAQKTLIPKLQKLFKKYLLE